MENKANQNKVQYLWVDQDWMYPLFRGEWKHNKTKKKKIENRREKKIFVLLFVVV
jgi:hypothetical protein